MLTEQESADLECDLAHFSGTETWWKHGTGRITFTDGVKYTSQNA